MGMGPKWSKITTIRWLKIDQVYNLYQSTPGQFWPKPKPVYVSHVRSKKPLPCNEALPVLQSVPENDTTPTIRDRALKKGIGSIGFSSFMIFPISYGQYLSAWWLFSIFCPMKTPNCIHSISVNISYIISVYILHHVPSISIQQKTHRHIATSSCLHHHIFSWQEPRRHPRHPGGE